MAANFRVDAIESVVLHYIVSQKNCANLYFALCWSNMNRFQNWYACPERNNKQNCAKVPTSPIMCASTNLGI